MQTLRMLCAVAAIGCFSSTARADSFTITGGQAGFMADDLTSFTLTGAGLSLVSDARNEYLRPTLHPGDGVALTGLLNPVGNESGHGFTAVVNGTTYSDVVLRGNASFGTSLFFMPPIDAVGSSFNITVPLSISGHFEGFPFGNSTASALFAVDVGGRGLFSTSFTAIDATTWFDTRGIASARFGSSSAPGTTPEPGTLLLVGSAIAGCVIRRRSASSAAPTQ